MNNERLSDKLSDKARGSLVGLAVGDALGANFEFTILSHEDVTDDEIVMRDGMWPKGAWTDDTSMALCLSNSLLERVGYDSYDVMKKYQSWVEDGYCSYDNKPAGDVGVQTRAAIEEFKRDPIVSRDVERLEQAGNGTIMRLAPVVIATAHELIMVTVKMARISARETHYSWEAEAGAEVFVAMLRQAMELKDKESIIRVERYSTGEIYDDILRRVLMGSKKDCRVYLEDLGGYVVDALAIAVWGFRNFSDFESGMRAVMKLGGDTDTNGAIYGQLAGAYYGYGAIPEEWKRELFQESRIRGTADRLLMMKSCPIIRTRFEEDGVV